MRCDARKTTRGRLKLGAIVRCATNPRGLLFDQFDICRVHCNKSVPNYLFVTLQLCRASLARNTPYIMSLCIINSNKFNHFLFSNPSMLESPIFIENYRLSSLIRTSQTSQPHHHFFPFFPFPGWSMLLKISSNVVPLGSVPEVGVSPLRLETRLCPLG